MLEQKLADVAKYMVCEKPVLVLFRIASGIIWVHLLLSVYLCPGGIKEMHLHLSTPVLTTLRNMGRCKQMQTDACATNKNKPNGTSDSFGTFGTFEINDLSSNSSF